ncbi:TetR/AcrR family transcriptional regulator [Actinomadura macrotermitis]|uniref:HTH tetR-type domain-containing protein n=1 Tax=Actinomadura macrotermitis TaxID=2585200 RepID=A0A7K0BNB9_9ACTN|nr:TetR/AcrR family transcriptional regulator [Actinomadura macrotermitis]MQY02675.1 hypothetical protein [Actinomadura macrotermitis]
MARLSRAQTQELTRARVLAAARAEFAGRGFQDAKIDAIAERAELTRGAVYSNFPGKRALYFAVLADLAEQAPEPPGAGPGRTPRDALGAFARAWTGRLPLAGGGEESLLGAHLLPEVLTDDRTRVPFAQLMRLNAVLLGLALENLGAPGRRVRTAEAVLTTLHGASRLAAAAPGFVDPFAVVAACERLAGLDLADETLVPPYLAEVRPADDPWTPPEATDAVRREPAGLTADGVLAVLGLHRLEAAEEAVRAAAPGEQVTVAVVTGDPGELAPLARLAVADPAGCLRAAFPMAAWPRLRVVHDPAGVIAATAGITEVDDATETAVRIAGGRIALRATGRGAARKVAAATARASSG